jgi:hypothetical protein
MWRNRSILLCRAGISADGNADRIGSEIMAGFRAQGWTATDIVVDPKNARATEAEVAARIGRGEFDIVMSVQAMGLITGPLADEIMLRGGVRRLYWALDHPYSGWTSVAQLPIDTILTYPTRSNLDCCRRFLRPDLRPICIPHAAARRDARPWSGRGIRAIFVGNASKDSPETIRRTWPQRYPPVWAGLLDAMAQRFEVNAASTLEGLAETALRDAGRDPAGIKQSDFMLLLSTFDAYARATVRMAYMTALRGHPITVVGTGWEFLAGHALDIRGPLPTIEARDLMSEAKLVLDLLPPWYRSHERIFEGMASASAVATTASGVLANVSGQADDPDPAERTAIISLGKPDEARARIDALLGDDAGLEVLAMAGHAEQRTRHGWDDRVKMLLDQVERTR